MSQLFFFVYQRAKLVPSILLSSADIPPDLLVRGEGCLIQARVCRPKKRLKNEDSASSVSSVSNWIIHSTYTIILLLNAALLII